MIDIDFRGLLGLRVSSRPPSPAEPQPPGRGAHGALGTDLAIGAGVESGGRPATWKWWWIRGDHFFESDPFYGFLWPVIQVGELLYHLPIDELIMSSRQAWMNIQSPIWAVYYWFDSWFLIFRPFTVRYLACCDEIIIPDSRCWMIDSGF